MSTEWQLADCFPFFSFSLFFCFVVFFMKSNGRRFRNWNWRHNITHKQTNKLLYYATGKYWRTYEIIWCVIFQSLRSSPSPFQIKGEEKLTSLPIFAKIYHFLHCSQNVRHEIFHIAFESLLLTLTAKIPTG